MASASASANGAPLKKTESYSASKSAMAAIFGPDHKYNKGGATEDSSETVASGSGTRQEPPSGVQGKGTVEEPYDQGNAPEQIGSKSITTATNGNVGEEPLSGVKGKGTVNEPYDQGNAGEKATDSQPLNSSATTSTTNGAGTPLPTPPKGQSEPSKAEETSRGRTLAPPANNDRFERSVSPGTLDDGTHEKCDGERGGSYTPSSGLRGFANKLKGR
ncbi:uncharacterized protein AB675_4140 [Cyphellophora attinorum]|uniref:Uncharacterized protein n=1 Tax=Cyphellophora attinorum TaxID=1664694 RepID=A0A0N1H794_9EURO|nr:uncharacterized protein AB675_4140 [Phialophora attinorum]KPI38476.1 hypothetical protein AB675_4140 [Phialophora attinorum]